MESLSQILNSGINLKTFTCERVASKMELMGTAFTFHEKQSIMNNKKIAI